ncbi:MAG: NADH-quinone oxidoreductase subunit C [Ignavibacteriales bacterium]|nr:NADH-quinone oxidoreductase subunit C [Ignavibacteriales bacterium]
MSHGMLVLQLAPARAARRSCARCKDEFGFDMFLDVTAVDWLGQRRRASRSSGTSTRPRTRCACGVKTRVAEADPTVDSLVAAVRLGRASWSASATRCTASSSAATPTCGRSCSTRASSATRCARTTRRSSEQPLVPYRDG